MIMVGPGNNGGDALFAGVRLARRGVRVTAVSCLGTPHPRRSAPRWSRPAVALVDLDDFDQLRDSPCRPGDRRDSRHRWPTRIARPGGAACRIRRGPGPTRSSPSTCRRAWPPTPAQHPARRYARHAPSPSASPSHATSWSRRGRTAARSTVVDIGLGTSITARPLTWKAWTRSELALALALSERTQRQVRPRRRRRRHRFGAATQAPG